MDFWQVVNVLNKRKWLILFSVAAAVAMTYGATRLFGSRWVATVQFVSPERSAVSTSASSDDSESVDLGARQAASYAAMIKSRDVIAPVLAQLGEPQIPINTLLENIEFNLAGPHLYELHVTDKNPARAKQIANGLADQFVAVDQNLRTQQAGRVVGFLEDQLKDVNAKLDTARAKYEQYNHQHQIIGTVSTDVDAGFAALQAAEKKRDEEMVKVAEAKARLHEAWGQIAALPPVSQFDVATTSGVLNQQLTELEKDQEALDQLRKTHKDNHPLVQQALANYNTLNNRIQQEWKSVSHSEVQSPALSALKQEIRALNLQVAGSQAQIRALNAQVAAAQKGIDKYTGTNAPFAALSEQVNELQDNHNSLVDRLNKARMALDTVSRQNTIMIMNPVSDFNPPVNSTKGHNLKLMLIAGLCALLLMSAIIVALDSMDQRVKNVREAELVLPARLLASIPQPSLTTSYTSIARATEFHPQSLQSEAYRFLGLHLLNGARSDVRSLMVLAAKAEQGSTSMLTNLGITLAQAGKRVILVDANIRTSEIHTVFGVENDFGFTNLLEDPSAESLERAIQPTSNECLHFITSGPPPRNAWQLFRSQNLLELSCLLHSRADYVLYDTPSSLMFTDALNLAPIVDAAILCVRALEPLTGTEERLIELLEQANVAVLGSVLSDVPPSVIEGMRNYQHYYKPLEAPVSKHGSQNGFELPHEKGAFPTVVAASTDDHAGANGKTPR